MKESKISSNLEDDLYISSSNDEEEATILNPPHKKQKHHQELKSQEINPPSNRQKHHQELKSREEPPSSTTNMNIKYSAKEDTNIHKSCVIVMKKHDDIESSYSINKISKEVDNIAQTTVIHIEYNSFYISTCNLTLGHLFSLEDNLLNSVLLEKSPIFIKVDLTKNTMTDTCNCVYLIVTLIAAKNSVNSTKVNIHFYPTKKKDSGSLNKAIDVVMTYYNKKNSSDGYDKQWIDYYQKYERKLLRLQQEIQEIQDSLGGKSINDILIKWKINKKDWPEIVPALYRHYPLNPQNIIKSNTDSSVFLDLVNCLSQIKFENRRCNKVIDHDKLEIDQELLVTFNHDQSMSFQIISQQNSNPHIPYVHDCHELFILDSGFILEIVTPKALRTICTALLKKIFKFPSDVSGRMFNISICGNIDISERHLMYIKHLFKDINKNKSKISSLIDIKYVLEDNNNLLAFILPVVGCFSLLLPKCNENIDFYSVSLTDEDKKLNISIDMKEKK